MRLRTSVSHAGHRFPTLDTGGLKAIPKASRTSGKPPTRLPVFPAPVRISSKLAGLGRDSLILPRCYLIILASGLRGQATPSELENTPGEHSNTYSLWDM